MKATLVLCLALAVCVSALPQQPIPYDVYVRNGGLPLPEKLRHLYTPISAQNSTFIVGGTEAAAGEVPWIASLSRTSHFCGGSVISSRTILTAAHCIDGQTASSLKVRVGSLRHASGGTQIGVSRIVKHASYSSSTIDYDIALVILSSDVPIGSNVQTVGLASSEPSSGTQVLVAGWGTTSSGSGSLPAALRRVNVNIVARTTCQSNYGSSSITNRMICAGVNGGGKDSCQGDSGGPLTINGVQYGVVSWGRGCASAGYPGVYTNVANLRSWIDANKQ